MKLNNSDPELDTALFQQAFATVAQKPSSLASDQKPKSAPVRAERVKLIDSKRSHNVELSLARFKMSPGEIRDAVLHLDQARLSAHQVDTLWKCCPTQPEIAMVRSYEGDTHMLGATEQLFLALSDVPNVADRVGAWAFQQSYDDLYQEAHRKVDVVQSALHDVEHADRFHQLLRLILAVGNVLNGGTPKGQAYGFRLAALRQLVSVKATDNSGSSLLHLIVRHVQQHSPGVGTFPQQLASLARASRVDSDACVAECRDLVRQMKSVEAQVAAFDDARSGTDRFKDVMSAFLTAKARQATALMEQVDELLADVGRVSAWYGGTPGKATWDALFRTLHDFAESYVQAERASHVAKPTSGGGKRAP